ncbi:MAG: hypothetical protein JW809_03960, partial [Pirellulales bacterium]|nr:hypothetical protein [Pirellulales bacterium]
MRASGKLVVAVGLIVALAAHEAWARGPQGHGPAGGPAGFAQPGHLPGGPAHLGNPNNHPGG